jgi:DivIVA domain-containing protein
MDIEVSARTLREVEFREKLRGYNQDDVDEFLERAAAGVELLHDRLRQALERAMRAEQRVSDLPDDDDALRRTLVLAQRTADMAVKESQQQARETLSNAQAEARAMVGEAEERARRTTEEAERDLRAELVRLENSRKQLHNDVLVLERHIEDERSRMRAALANAQAWIEHNLTGMAPAPPLSDVDVPAPPTASTPPAEEPAGRAAREAPGPNGEMDHGRPPVVVGPGGRGPAGPGQGGHGPGGRGPEPVEPPGPEPNAGGGVFDAEQWEASGEDNPSRIFRVQGSAGADPSTRVTRGRGPAGGREQV